MLAACCATGLINAIELDLKDESGVVGYDSKLPYANKIGAVEASYELDDGGEARSTPSAAG